jgi:LysM repeat protein
MALGKTIPNHDLPKETTHITKIGETLYHLTKRYSVSLAQLLL